MATNKEDKKKADAKAKKAEAEAKAEEKRLEAEAKEAELKTETMEELDKLSVDYDKTAPVKDLVKLLKDSVKAGAKMKPKAPSKIEGTGKFVVVAFEDGSRLYNENGVAVSPVETESKAVSKLARQSARANALVRARTIKTPAGHEEK